MAKNKSSRYHLLTDSDLETRTDTFYGDKLYRRALKLSKLAVVFIVFVLVFVCLILNKLYLVQVNTFEQIQILQHLQNDSRWLIDTSTCRIPNIATFDEQTRENFESHANTIYQCPKPTLTAQIYRENFTQIHLPVGHRCEVKEVVRYLPTDTWDYGKIHSNMTGTVEFLNDVDAVEVTCSNTSTPKVIPLIPLKVPQTGFYTSWFKPEPEFNVLLYGIDSVSRLNSNRHLLRTRQFLANKGFVEFFGHHKIGKNSFPNLVPMMIGEPFDRWDNLWNPAKKTDALPLIFNKYRNSGYLTTYIEDMTKYGLFTYHTLNGFIDAPTDYYIKPASELLEKDVPWGDPCYHDQLQNDVYNDYVLDLFEAVKQRQQKLLTHVHMSTLTHDNVNNVGYADMPTQRFMDQFFEAKFNENTVIIFYSDHPIRYGPSTTTNVSFYEGNMPFFYVYIPPTLRLMNGNGKWIDAVEIKNVLKTNAYRLTAQMDVHATLMHILDRIPVMEERYGQSLFVEVPERRTCENAGIPLEFCSCNPWTVAGAKFQSSVEKLARGIIERINELLKKFENKCEILKLLSIEQSEIREDFLDAPENSGRVFRLTFITSPNNGTFRTILNENEIDKLPHYLERLDKYSEQSVCVANTIVEAYCLCKS